VKVVIFVSITMHNKIVFFKEHHKLNAMHTGYRSRYTKNKSHLLMSMLFYNLQSVLFQSAKFQSFIVQSCIFQSCKFAQCSQG